MSDDPEVDGGGRELSADELLRLMLDTFSEADGAEITAAAEERHVARGRRLFHLYARPDLWHPLESALRAMRTIEAAMAGSTRPVVGRVAVLATRVRGDAEEALEALLVGLPSASSDAMRDVMECELLVRWFASEPAVVEEWVTANREELVERFGPGRVRARVAETEGLQAAEQLPDAWEYEVHSHGLHATPDEPSAVGKLPSGTLDDVEGIAGEIVVHVWRFAAAVDAFIEVVGESPIDRPRIAPIANSLLPVLGDKLPQRIPRPRAERRRIEKGWRKQP